MSLPRQASLGNVAVPVAAVNAARIVRQWPGLSAPAKLAWSYVFFDVAKGKPAVVDVSPAALCGALGLEDSRSGRQALDQLAEHRLLNIIARNRGSWRIDVFDPSQAAIARPCPMPGEGQGELPFADDPQVRHAEEQHEPESSAQNFPVVPLRRTSERREIPQTSDFRDFGERKSQVSRSGSGNERAELSAAHPILMGSTIETVIRRLPSEAEKQARVEELMVFIRGQVADPLLRDSVLLRIAWAIMDGRYSEQKLHAVLRRVAETKRRGTLRGTPSQYFVGAVKRSFAESGLDWGSAPRRAT